MRTSAALWALALMAGVAGSCTDSSVAAPATHNALPLVAGEVRAEVTPESVIDGLTTFVVRIRTRDVTVSSYQGAVRFRAGAMDLVTVTTPSAGNAAYVVNSTSFAAGRVPFVVFSTSSFAGTETDEGVEVFRFTARVRGSAAPPAVTASLDVVVKARAEN